MMVPAQSHNQSFCSDFTLYDDDSLAKSLCNIQQQQLFNNLDLAKNEGLNQFYPTINSDFTLFDHDFDVPVSNPQKFSDYSGLPQVPQNVEQPFPPVKQTPQMTDIPVFTQPTSENSNVVDFDFMSSFATPYTPYQSDFSGNNSLVSPYTPCAPYTPVYPVLDFAPTPYVDDGGQFDSSPAQSTPFLTPHIDFEQGTFTTVPNVSPSNPITKPGSFDMSLYCKDGSFHVDDGPNDDRLPVLVAPLEEVASYHNHSNEQTKTNPQSNYPSRQSKKDPSTRLTAPKEKKYACDVCGLRFARKFNLNVHARGHNPKLARPFRCTQCTKAFGRKHDLSRHLATVHNGERPFSCDSCHKCFSRKDGLHRHLLKGCPGFGQ